MDGVSRAASLGALVLAMLTSACDGGPKGTSVSLQVSALSAAPAVLEHPEGARVDVPAMASSVDRTLVITTLPSSHRVPPSSVAVATPIWLEPEGATFEKALTVSITIEPSHLPPGKTIDDVVIATAPHGSSAFVPLPTRRAGSAVVAETTHFSDFVAVVGIPNGADAGFDGSVDGGVDASDDAAIDASDDAAIDASSDAAVDAALPAPNGLLHMFETAINYTGGLGGPAGADAKCMSDANRPTSGNYKALLFTVARRACLSPYCDAGVAPLDWVFAPSQTYYIGAVGSESAFAATDGNAIISANPMISLGSRGNFWLGATADWQTNAMNCADFSDGINGQGAVGWDFSTDGGWITGGASGCGANYPIVCVEQ